MLAAAVEPRRREGRAADPDAARLPRPAGLAEPDGGAAEPAPQRGRATGSTRSSRCSTSTARTRTTCSCCSSPAARASWRTAQTHRRVVSPRSVETISSRRVSWRATHSPAPTPGPGREVADERVVDSRAVVGDLADEARVDAPPPARRGRRRRSGARSRQDLAGGEHHVLGGRGRAPPPPTSRPAPGPRSVRASTARRQRHQPPACPRRGSYGRGPRSAGRGSGRCRTSDGSACTDASPTSRRAPSPAARARRARRRSSRGDGPTPDSAAPRRGSRYRSPRANGRAAARRRPGSVARRPPGSAVPARRSRRARPRGACSSRRDRSSRRVPRVAERLREQRPLARVDDDDHGLALAQPLDEKRDDLVDEVVVRPVEVQIVVARSAGIVGVANRSSAVPGKPSAAAALGIWV